jgi:hypothetical protein
VTSKENEEAKGKVAANVAAESDRDRSGSGNGDGTAVYGRDEGRAGRGVYIRSIRKKEFARHLHQTLFRPPLPARF